MLSAENILIDSNHRAFEVFYRQERAIKFYKWQNNHAKINDFQKDQSAIDMGRTETEIEKDICLWGKGILLQVSAVF